jgi:ABC-type transport system involved in cytochrome c biogenesis permease subunit
MVSLLLDLMVSPLITDHLLKIMNACFFLSYFPTCWKAAKVVVIGKPNKPAYDSLNSFRPISVANTLAKVLEKLILRRVRWLSGGYLPVSGRYQVGIYLSVAKS